MLKKVIDLTSHEAKGLNTNPNVFSLTKDQYPNLMNVIVDHDGSLKKRLGTTTMNSTIIADSGGSGFSPDNALTTSLQAWWNLNESSGDRKDSFGGHTLVDNNSVLQASGIKNAAALFVAANSEYLLHVNTSTLTTGNVDFSMAAWFYLNSTSPTLERTIISKIDTNLDSDVVLLLHCDGSDAGTTFTDNSLSAKTVTANGNANTDTGQFKFGTASAQLDGTGDFLSLTDHDDFDFGTGDFTVDFWMRWNGAVGTDILFAHGTGANGISMLYNPAGSQWEVTILTFGRNFTWTPSADTWYHVALTRRGTDLKMFIDGTQIGSTLTDSGDITNTGTVTIGAANDGSAPFDGWIDEFRIIKGRSAYNTNFTAPSSAHSNPSTPTLYEYHLYVNTDNFLTFKVSNSGTGGDITVRATSFGAVGTGTWYNAVAYHDAGANQVAVGINLSMTSASYTTGVKASSAPFVIGAISNGVSGFFDGRIDEVGFWKKKLSTQDRADIYNLGTGNTYATSFGRDPWASFDFGAGSNNNRWLIVAAATGVYASSNLGVTWVNIATDRTANYQYFERSKNILVSGSDSYDSPLFWAGSGSTFMAILNTSAPLVKYWINHQGFLIGLNTNTRKRGFYYEDENTQLTGDWADSFDIPSSADDEITGAFILRRRLYVSTRYFLYGVDYVGGNPDWSFRKIKDFGYVPRTMKIIPIEGIGEVAIGLDWGNKIRIFDGSEDKIISSNIKPDNKLCEFALDKVSNSGSGKVVSFAETDRNENFYKLCLAIGNNSTQTTHFLNFNGRSQAFWADDNRPFNTMTNAESNNTSFTMAFDRSGRCHMLDSGNLDFGVTAINDILDSSYLFDKTPSQDQKSHKIDLFFVNNTAGRVYFKDRHNFSKSFNDRYNFIISGSDNKFIFYQPIDIPSEGGVYQFRITSSSGTSDPWQLARWDYFAENLGIGEVK